MHSSENVTDGSAAKKASMTATFIKVLVLKEDLANPSMIMLMIGRERMGTGRAVCYQRWYQCVHA